MNKKSGLGKGLDAIFVENDAVAKYDSTAGMQVKNDEGNKKQEAKITDIFPNPYQPRQVFDEEKLQELAISVKEYGIIEPLIVRAKGKKFELVAGERRLRAAKLAGLKTVPIVIREYDDVKLMEIALIENIQRHDLSPLEEAKGLKRLMTECRMTQEQVADKVGRSRSAVANILRLLNMPKEIQEYIASGKLNMGQAKTLSGLGSEEQQCAVARLIIENDWSARIVEEVVRKLKEGKLLKVVCEVVEKKDRPEKKAAAKENDENDMFYRSLESKLVEILGTKVKVQPKSSGKGDKGGTIQIEYYSQEDLNRIYEALQRKEEIKQSQEIKRLHV